MANPQPTDSHIRIANQIETELLRCKFTGRQYSILRFILRLSWGCGRKTAVIPKLVDFELCGVGKTHIRKELEHLVDMRIIGWNEHTNEFDFNKNYDQWRVTPAKGWDEKRFKELLSINISQQRASYQNGNFVTENDVTELPKEEQSYHKKDVTELPKEEPKNPEKPCHDRSGEPPITILDKTSPPTTPTPTARDVYQSFEQEFGRPISPMEYERIGEWLDQDSMPPEMILEALKEAVLNNARNLTYIDRVILAWKQNNVFTKEALAVYRENRARNGPQRPKVYPFPEGGGNSRPNPADRARQIYEGSG